MNAVVELSLKTGKSKVTIYKLMRELGRLPTEEEVLKVRKAGRPKKYNY